MKKINVALVGLGFGGAFVDEFLGAGITACGICAHEPAINGGKKF